MVIEHGELYVFLFRLPRRPTQEFVNLDCCFFPIGNGIDDQARTKGDVAGSEDPW